MKKTIVALASFAAISAFAQSNVTISGAVDLGVVKIDGAPAKLDAANGANEIKFSGVEDLGGGLKASFTLTQRFSPESGMNDGTKGDRPAFQGESTVGLAGNFGSVKVGRSLTAFQANINRTDPWQTRQQASVGILSIAPSTGPAAAGPAYRTDVDVVGAGANAARTDAITYATPKFGNVSAVVSYGFKQSHAALGNQALVSGWVSYDDGKLYAGAGAEENRKGDRIVAGLATYDLGVVKVGGGYARTSFIAGGADRETWNAAATAPVGSVIVKAGLAESKVGGVADVRLVSAGVDYPLSKRTTIYTSAGYNQIKSVSGYDFGIRHAF